MTHAQTSNATHTKNLLEQFYQQYGHSEFAVHAFFAPGRVNLIGEYTDFTGGLVFPCAVSQGTWLLIRRSHNHQYRLTSTNFDFSVTLDREAIARRHDDHWINYPLGVLDQFAKRGVALDGFDCLYSGNVPNGAGLSSSASIEVVTAFAINALMACEYPMLELVTMSQAAENEFVGMQCGVMDQFAVAMAKKDHAMQLKCATLEHRQVPLPLDTISIVVANTNQRRELNDSAYNTRVEECERALQALKPVTGISELGQLTPTQLSKHETLLAHDPVALHRASHICEENERVRAAVPALESKDLQRFGQLMNASHDSLRDLFDVSSEPLDHLVRLAREQPGVLGSRLTGAGFGGCTVSLVPTDTIDSFKEQVGSAYTQATGLEADFYVMSPGNGVRQLPIGSDLPS